MSQDPQTTPPFPQQDRPPQAHGQQPVVQKTNTMAILALVFAFVFAPLGIVFGVMGRKQIARSGEGGRGLATAGLVLGIIFTVFLIIYIIGVIALVSSGSLGELNQIESGSGFSY